MKEAKTFSLVIPFRNRSVDVFEVALKSLEMQTRSVDEVILVDISSSEPFKSNMQALCEKYHVKRYYIPINLPSKVIEVYLWNTCFNYGIRKATSDFIMYSGMDRVYENNMVQCVLDYYNWNIKQGKESLVCGKVYNLLRTPKLSELNNFSALIDKATWRGGYGFWGSSKEWFYKVRGLDETIRWYEDLDLTRRAILDGLNTLWVSHGSVLQHVGRASRTLHLADHPVGRKKHEGQDIVMVARRGKAGLRLRHSITRNDETWGVLTEKKLKRALRLSEMSIGEILDFQACDINPFSLEGPR